MEIIDACLVEADALKKETMAFCALGTGLLQYPAECVAECFVKAVTKFCQKMPDNTVTTIFVVAYDKDAKTIKVQYEMCLMK